MDKSQRLVDEVYQLAFRRTPLTKRLKIIIDEAVELNRFVDMKNLREETGDLLSAVLQLCNECGWSAEEVLQENLDKIKHRMQQYILLGRKTSVAIIGGAFDPIHEGHIALARFLLNVREFDCVWLMPCYQHMYGKKMASPEHRLEMCRLATQGDGRIHVSDYEITRKLSGETYNLVSHLLQEDFAKNEFDFSLVIGTDNANTFDKWVNYQDLERMIRFVVVNRKGMERDPNVNWYMKPPHLYFDTASIDLASVVPGYSSTQIRQCISGNMQTKDHIQVALNRDVLNFIQFHSLYKHDFIVDMGNIPAKVNINIPVSPQLDPPE